jgi:hypothetical protein
MAATAELNRLQFTGSCGASYRFARFDQKHWTAARFLAWWYERIEYPQEL